MPEITLDDLIARYADKVKAEQDFLAMEGISTFFRTNYEQKLVEDSLILKALECAKKNGLPEETA